MVMNLLRGEIGREQRSMRRDLKESRGPRRLLRAALKPMNVILDSLSGLPGIGALTEIKDGTAVLLDAAEDIDQRRYAP